MQGNKEDIAYMRGFADGIKQAKNIVASMKKDVYGCIGCAFGDVSEWEMPCAKCNRNSKDYWRAKKVE